MTNLDTIRSTVCAMAGALVAVLGCAGVAPRAAGSGGNSGGVDGSSDGRPIFPIIDASFETTPSSSGDGGICQNELRAVVRDFRSGEKDGQPRHPDFEVNVAVDPGIVATMLGPDVKPVYAGGTTGTTSTKENFDQW